MTKITEGYMPYLEHQTYYRIVGEKQPNGKAPLICLHGGRALPIIIMRCWIIWQMTMPG